MGTIFNSKVFKGVSIAGKIVKGMVKNGVTFYEKKELPSNAILDLPFQNNFTDYGKIGMTMVAGGTSNQPTFALSGRKAGEYCAVFNGSQSIKTTTNLPINSDKVTIAFWIKTSQTSIGFIADLASNINLYLNVWANTLAFNNIKQGNNVVQTTRSQLSTWKHIVITNDRTLGANQSKIYVNGILSFTQRSDNATNNTGNYTNNILFIGHQYHSLTYGFNGSLTKLKIYNYPFTPSEASNLYNSEL